MIPWKILNILLTAVKWGWTIVCKQKHTDLTYPLTLTLWIVKLLTEGSLLAIGTYSDLCWGCGDWRGCCCCCGCWMVTGCDIAICCLLNCCCNYKQFCTKKNPRIYSPIFLIIRTNKQKSTTFYSFITK